MSNRLLIVASGIVLVAGWVNGRAAAGFVVAVALSNAFADASGAHLLAKYSAATSPWPSRCSASWRRGD